MTCRLIDATRLYRFAREAQNALTATIGAFTQRNRAISIDCEPAMSSVTYHCTCTSASIASDIPPPPTVASSTFAFQPLHALYFCEECDRVRCNRCVAVEVSGYYCPNCLFEVPSASVRAEKNRSVQQGSTSYSHINVYSDVPETVSNVLIVETHSPSSPRIPRRRCLILQIKTRERGSANRLSSFIATTVGGIVPK